MGTSRKIKIGIIALLCLIPAVIGFTQEFKSYIFSNFSTGEISRKLDTRIDFEKMNNGARIIQNMNVFPQGGVFKRPGTYFVSGVSDSSKAIRLIPFIYSTEEAYVIEFGDYYARFYKDHGQIQTVDEYTKLLLHCNGMDGSQTFTDASWNARIRPTITANGNVNISTDTYQFPSGSASFDGNGDYLMVPDSSDYQSGTTAFTIDFWVNFNSTSGFQPLWTTSLSGNSNYVCFYYEGTTNSLRFDNMIGGENLSSALVWSWTPVLGAWYHVALIRGWGGDPDKWTVTVNGDTLASAKTSTRTVTHLSGASYYVGGTINNFTPDYGGAGYAFNFLGNSGITNAQYKFGTGSLYLDGAGDYLSTHDDSSWDFSGTTLNTNYTISFFVRHTNLTGAQTYLSQYLNASNYWALQKTAGSGVIYSMVSAGVNLISTPASSVTPTAGQWDHVALIRTQARYGIYINGVQVSYENDKDIGTFAAPLYIGGLGAGSYLNGCIDNLVINPSNPFSAAPNSGLTNTITVPTVEATSIDYLLYLNFDWPFLNGYLDEVRYSSTTRWTMDFTPETDEYPLGASDAGTACQITTPYAEGDLADLKYAQSENTLYVAHRKYPPWKLTRTSHDDWTGTTVSFKSNILVSGASGYPGCVEFHEQRLMWAGSYNFPQTIWMSVSGEYENLTSGSTDSAAIAATLSASSVNSIRWMNSSKSLIVGTTGGEWIVGPATSSESITPSNIQAKRHATPGTSNVQGLKIGSDTIDIQYSGRKVRELTYSYEIEGYKSDELSLLAEHLFTGYTITQMAYQGEPFNILWCLRSDGILLGLTYLKASNIYAWTRFVTDGVIENITVIPSDNGDDELWLEVERNIITSDILNKSFDSLANWTKQDSGTAVSEIDPAGWLRLDTNLGAAGNASAKIYRTITLPPNKFTIEIKTYFDSLGSAWNDGFWLTYSNITWFFSAYFSSSGLRIMKTAGGDTEVGVDIVKCNAGAAGQTWRFQVDKSAGESLATVEVFLKEEGGAWVSQGTVDCDYEVAGQAGVLGLQQYGEITDNMVSHVDYIKIATGLGEIDTGDRYIEYMMPSEFDTIANMFYVDSGLSYSGSGTTSFSGLDHLSGRTVVVLADGAYIGEKLVSSGGTFVLTNPASTVHAGLPYTSILETIDIPNNIIDKKRVLKMVPSFYKTSYFKYGSNTTNAMPYVFKSGVTPYTGYLEMPVPGGWSLERTVYFESANPLSFSINGLQVNIE